MDLIENVGRRSRAEGDQGDFIDVGLFSVNGYERNALFRNLGNGRFVDVAYTSGCDRIEDGRGLGLLDLDRDGDLDLVVNNFLAPANLLVNRAPSEHHWLRLDLDGRRAPDRPEGSNRDAVGARVVIEHSAQMQSREVITTAGYLSGQSPYLHFGLGLDTVVDRLTIHWPSGLVQEFTDIEADRFYRVLEGEDAIEPRPEQLEEPSPQVPAGVSPATLRAQDR